MNQSHTQPISIMSHIHNQRHKDSARVDHHSAAPRVSPDDWDRVPGSVI